MVCCSTVSQPLQDTAGHYSVRWDHEPRWLNLTRHLNGIIVDLEGDCRVKLDQALRDTLSDTYQKGRNGHRQWQSKEKWWKKIENREPHVINLENVGKAGMRIQSTTVSLEQPRHKEKGKKIKTDKTQKKVMGKKKVVNGKSWWIINMNVSQSALNRFQNQDGACAHSLILNVQHKGSETCGIEPVCGPAWWNVVPTWCSNN